MKNIIWADSQGKVRITTFAPDYEGTSQDHAAYLAGLEEYEGFTAVLFDQEINGGAQDYTFNHATNMLGFTNA